MKAKAIQHQTLMDIALTTTGNVRGVVALAIANAVSITESLTPGQEVSCGAILDIDIVTFYQTSSSPSTGYPTELGYIEAQQLPVVLSQSRDNKIQLTPIEGQNFMDLAIQSSGGVQGVMDFAVKNNISITDSPEVGGIYKKTKQINHVVLVYYQNRNLRPATGANEGCIYTVCDYVEFNYWE
ncbi:MAG: hypothetical protein CVU03_04995 [Bacteroidetes bacterium HGW-Bacteroidetes-2]|jgi:hypothetical protein|nr:MAG: hypothetical protein CVU03_04995 [Bacteroidetes bacterium HGW-Bacteroidetes-2]